MVTATTGTITFRGASGADYSWSIYVSDVDAAPVRFSSGGAAGAASSDNIIVPENCVLKDISTLLSPTVAVTMIPSVNDRPTGDVIHDANTLSTLTTRSFPRMRVPGRCKFSMVQK